MIKKITAILSLVPGAEVTVRGDEVIWHNPKQSPVTEKQIQDEYDRLLLEEPKNIAKQNRQVAYASEADPLFFKAQRGEATMEEWKAKIEEIKARFPYSEE